MVQETAERLKNENLTFVVLQAPGSAGIGTCIGRVNLLETWRWGRNLYSMEFWYPRCRYCRTLRAPKCQGWSWLGKTIDSQAVKKPWQVEIPIIGHCTCRNFTRAFYPTFGGNLGKLTKMQVPLLVVDACKLLILRTILKVDEWGRCPIFREFKNV